MNSSLSIKTNPSTNGSRSFRKAKPVNNSIKKKRTPVQQQQQPNAKANAKTKPKADTKPVTSTAINTTTLTPHVDRNAYECTIHDLNQKLANLRSHLTLMNDTNALLTNTVRILELDRAEAISYYMRNVDECNQSMLHLEERLRNSEYGDSPLNTSECQMLNMLEEQYKAIHGQLSCEIKMLTSKLHSLEQFRMRRDQLLAKLENQRLELEASENAHREILYDVEQKMIGEKQALQQEVESKLQQLSKDFNRYNRTIPTDFVNCLQPEVALAPTPRAMEITSNVTKPQLIFRNCRTNWKDESMV